MYNYVHDVVGEEFEILRSELCYEHHCRSLDQDVIAWTLGRLKSPHIYNMQAPDIEHLNRPERSRGEGRIVYLEIIHLHNNMSADRTQHVRVRICERRESNGI